MVSLVSERAGSECARSTTAVGTMPSASLNGCPFNRREESER
jgi:hypothetical protein